MSRAEEFPSDPVVQRPWWYTAEEITQLIAKHVGRIGQVQRWLREGLHLLPRAVEHNDLERCLQQPVTSIDQKYDTLIAASLRYKLRRMGLEAKAPRWTYKEPLDDLWFPSAHRVDKMNVAINQTPPELRRVGIMLAEHQLAD